MLTRQEIEGLVLAGGRATRMGGGDKSLRLLDGEPLLSHVVRRLAPQVDQVAIASNAPQALHRRLAARLVADDAADAGSGPLAGLDAALRSTRHPWIAMVPCDAPRLPEDLVERLAAALRPGLLASIAETLDGMGEPRLQPACALIHRDAAPHLRRSLAEGTRALHRVLAGLPHAVVRFDRAEAFVNVNTPDDLAALERPVVPSAAKDLGAGASRPATRTP